MKFINKVKTTSKRKIDLGIIHCSATSPSMDIGATEINEWHVARGWSAIGYHFVIRRDGELELGRDLDQDGDVMEEIGAHAAGYNSSSIGICLVGGKDRFDFTFTQLETLRDLIDSIQAVYPNIKWIGHYEVNPHKTCPRFNVQEFLK